MLAIDFEWDENKNKSNLEKHGLDFNDAKDVFKDKENNVTDDVRKDYGEDRFKVVGKVKDLVLAVIFTVRDTVTRIISARSANRKEKEDYTIKWVLTNTIGKTYCK